MSSAGGGGGGGGPAPSRDDQAASDKENKQKNLSRTSSTSPAAQAQAVQQAQANSNDQAATQAGVRSSDNGAPPTAQQVGVPRRPRPVVHRATNAQLLRRGQLMALANQQHGGAGAVLVEPQPAGYGVPITAQIELAHGVLQPAGRATAMPPKRPNYLPARNDHQPRYHTSLGATALTSGPGNKPNRYSWAQMQQWHAAQNAAAHGMEAPTGGGPFGQKPGHKGSAGNLSAGSGIGQARPRAGGFHHHFSSPFSSAASRVLVVPNPIVNLGEHTKSRLIKIIEALKRFSEKWFSHVLLLLFLASYACLGAYIFISFEAPTEMWEKQLIIETRARIVNESYDQAHELSTRDEYLDAFRSRFEDYERLLNRMCASGMSSSSLDNQWTFWGALFYSMTVFTTIGYGHLTPITFAGRVATMIYAIFGIPILLMVLADLGKLLTRIIKYAFKKFRYWYNKLLGRKASVRTRKLISDHSHQYIGVAKSAFERGFANYIQAYQSRIPGAFREAQARMTGSLRPARPDQSGAAAEMLDESGILLVDQTAPGKQQASAPDGPHQPTMETSEIIVTPAKQTKPVSPKVNQNASKHPLADIEHHQHHNQHHNQHHHHHHHDKTRDKRALSPSGQAKRKISAGSKHPGKGSVSRSSSASNVTTSGERHSKAAAGTAAPGKRSSLDQAAAASQQPISTEGTGAEQSHVGSANEISTSSAKIEQQQQELAGHSAQGSQQELEAGELIGDEFEELDEDLDIPVSFALFLLITYMMFGAVIFSIWESWNFFDALYFVFISMSTIGFGDLVPQHPKRMIGTFAYLLFGLALTSMCINVVQEKIHATFLRAKMQIGEKMGFDLDQIMADDYYDSGSAYGDEPDHLGGPMEHDEDTGSLAHSLAASQANSQVGEQQQLAGSVNQSASDLKAAAASLDHTTEAASLVPAAKSKSKESLKWRKRASGGSTEQQHSLSSMRRKPSSSGRKQQPARQTSSPAPLAAPPQAASAAPVGGPIKPQVETIRMFNLPVQSQLEESKQRAPPAAPCINQPIAEGIRSFCEPLRRAFQGASANLSSLGRQATLPTTAQAQQAARSSTSQPGGQDSAGARSSLDVPAPATGNHVGGARQNGSHQPATAASIRASTLRNGNANQRHLHHSERVRGQSRPLSRSLNSSRRASVSHELSQLDDLIVALSGEMPERFGPLLGIPSAGQRQGRSASPKVTLSSSSSSGSGHSSSNNNNILRPNPTQTPSGGPDVANRRRGVSVVGRSPMPVGEGRFPQPPTSSGSVQRRPLVQSPSHQLLSSNHLAGSNNELHQDQRRKSSSSSTATWRSAASRSHLNQPNELNLSESQAALDELEAVKYSAV